MYPSRNESVVSSCIAAAIEDTLVRQHLQPIGVYDLTYIRQFVDDHNYHRNILAIYPEEVMTWGMWATALTGVDWFVESYKGWDFMFEVFSVEETDKGRSVRLLGEGYLWTLDELPPSEQPV